MPSQIRLIKIASEINIGKDTIVEYLSSCGFKLENKPTAVLSAEMVDAVFKKFKNEKKSADKQRAKIQKQKEKGVSVTKSHQLAIEIDENKSDDEKKQQEYDDFQDLAQEKTVENVEKSVTVSSDLIDLITVTPTVELETETIEKHTVKVQSQDEIASNLPQIGAVIDLPGRGNSGSSRKNKKATSNQKTSTSELSKAKTSNSIKTSASTVKKDGKNGTKRDKKDRKEAERKQKIEKQEIKISSKVLSVSKSQKESNSAKFDKKVEAKDVKIVADIEVKAKIEAVPNNILNSENVDNIANENVLNSNDSPNNNSNNETAKSTFETKNNIQNKPTVEKDDEYYIDKNGRRKKKRTIENEPSEQPGEKPNLKGLTVLGKIELQKEIPTKDSFRSRRDKDKLKNERNDRDRNGNDRERRRFGQKPINSENKNETFRKRNSEFGDKSKPKKFDNAQNQNSDYKSSQKQKDEKSTTVYHANAKPSVAKTKTYSNAPPKGSKVSTNYDEKRRKRKSIRDSITAEDIDRAIRETLIGMEDSGNSGKKTKIKQKKKAEREERAAKQQEIIDREEKTLKLTEFVTTNDLATMLNIKVSEIILKCMQLGLMVTINQRLDKDTILLIADDYNFEVEFIENDDFNEIFDDETEEDETLLTTRPPIVTIMGHVDHGKTSLLDHIRNANVVAGEAGGITQHIGAYRVILKNGKSITFLDTPGHEAFTAMRARGAQVTDIVVLVVAADDNVMPQTVEAISHARAANVPIVVAINKVDKPDSNIDKIKQQLSEQGILVEDWGGKYQCAEISAKKGTNVNVLLDKILLEAEMLELKANANRKAQGIVIESKMTKGWGNVASVIIQKGTLWIGDSFVAGANYGKIRVLLDERGNKVEDVLPSQPVVVIGFDGLPEAGDVFAVLDSETEAREIATHRKQLRREQEMRKVRHVTLDDISAQISIGGTKDLNLIIKGDAAGSVEALSDSLLKLSTEEVRVNILLKGSGAITESDVMLASASGAVIIGFNTVPTPQAAKLAEIESIDIRNYNIIYDCINEIHLALEGMLRPDIKEEIVALVEVRQIFKISRIGQIAGCYVTSGKVSRNDKIRILRNGFAIFTGTISSLKRNKDDAKEVDTNYECGIQIANFNNFEVGDVIEALKMVEVKRVLAINK